MTFNLFLLTVDSEIYLTMVVYPSRVFFYLKHVCISNQLNCTTIEKPRHWIPYHSL